MIARMDLCLKPVGARSHHRFLSRFSLIVVMMLGIFSPTLVVAEGTPETLPAESAAPVEIPAPPVVEPAPPVPDPAPPVVEPAPPVVEPAPDPVEDPGTSEPAGDDDVAPADAPPPDQLPATADSLDDAAASPSTPVSTEPATETPVVTPAIPFVPEVTCEAPAGRAPPVAGATNWTILDCTVGWDTSDVSTVSLLPIDPAVEWEMVGLNDLDLQNPDQLILASQPLELRNVTPAGRDYLSTNFHLAMRVSCVDNTPITVPLEFRATSGEDALVETATARHQFSATDATLPEISLTSAVFEDASPPNGTTVSTGVITMDYNNASENCGWSITTTVADFVAPEGVLSASDLSLVNVSGPAGLTSSIADGVITLHAAPGVTMPANGTIAITVSIPVPETVSTGVYSTTITADAGAP